MRRVASSSAMPKQVGWQVQHPAGCDGPPSVINGVKDPETSTTFQLVIVCHVQFTYCNVQKKGL